MKKLLLGCCLIVWAASAFEANAQTSQTITVSCPDANGSHDQPRDIGHFPFTSINMDKRWQRSQVVYRSSWLTEMVGSRITKMTIHAQRHGLGPASTTWANATGVVKIRRSDTVPHYNDLPPDPPYFTGRGRNFPTNRDAVLGLLNFEDFQTVWTGTFSFTGDRMEFEFDTPFTYTGGHLIVEVLTDERAPQLPGSDAAVWWIGRWNCQFILHPTVPQPTAQACYMGFNIVAYIGGGPNDPPFNWRPHGFLPRTSFEFTPFVSHNITASANTGGTISPLGVIAVEEGASQTFTISPNAGFRLDSVLINEVNNPAVVTSRTYTFSNVTQEHTIRAVFSRLSYTITATSDPNGTITPSGAISVFHGNNQTFSFTPNTGYLTQMVLVNGVNNPTAVANGTHTFTNVTGPQTIHAMFQLQTYIITPSVDGANGTIMPNFPTPVSHGGSQRFDFNPEPGFQVATVLINGTNNPTAVANGYHIFENVTGNQTIVVAFETQTFNIVSSVNGGNGTITPFGTTRVTIGGNQTFNIAANATFEIDELLVDGVREHTDDGVRFWQHEFVNVQNNHTIEVSFRSTGATSIEIFEGQNRLVLYPNPVTDILNINADEPILQIVVSDLSGRVWMQQQGNQNTINLQTLPAGNYVVNVHLGSTVVPVKIVKK